MNRRSFLHTAAALGAPFVAAPLVTIPGAAAQAARGPAGEDSSHSSDSARRIERATAAAMAMQRRDWEQGIFAQALVEAGDRERVILLTKAAIVQRTPDGRLGVVVSGMLDWIRNKAPRNQEGILYHTFRSPEMWSDGLNGAPPFLAAMGFHDDALAQIEGYRQRLWNPEKKLLAHIWDDGKRQFADPNFLGGGNGWAAAGLARVVRSLPRSE